MEETELRDRLHDLARRSAPTVRDDDELVQAVEAGVRTGRRRQWTVAAVAAALCAVLVAVPLSRSDEDARPAAPTPASAPEIYSIPTRGNVAADQPVVDAVRRLPWTARPGDPQVNPPPLDNRHVVFVGDHAGTRWALVVAADSSEPPPPDEDGDGIPDLDRLERVMAAWFAGPSGGAPEDMTLQTVPLLVRTDEPTGLASLSDRFIVVVAAPGDQIDVPPLRTVEADGEVVRTPFDPVPDDQGVAVLDADLRQPSADPLPPYRVVRGGTEFIGRFYVLLDPDFVVPEVDLAHLRPALPPAPGDAAVAEAIDDLAARLGAWPAVADWTVLWAGDLPRLDGGSARLTVLAAVFESGAVYVTGALGWDPGDGGTLVESCGSEIRPSGTPLDEQFVLVRCDAEGGSGPVPTSSLVIVGPPGTAAAQAWNANEEVLGEYRTTDRVAVVPVPDGLSSVEVVDADGQPIARRSPMETAEFSD
jgi:hypothetical protein